MGRGYGSNNRTRRSGRIKGLNRSRSYFPFGYKNFYCRWRGYWKIGRLDRERRRRERGRRRSKWQWRCYWVLGRCGKGRTRTGRVSIVVDFVDIGFGERRSGKE